MAKTLRVRMPGEPVPKKPRITDKAAPLRSALNTMSTNVAIAFAHNQKFSYEDFLNLFVREDVRDCLMKASMAGWATNYPTAEIDLPSFCKARFTLQQGKFIGPRREVVEGISACTNLELRQRFMDWFEQKREFAIGFARARIVVAHLAETYDPHVATYLLPSIQLLAQGTEVEHLFVRAGVGTVPTLPSPWREACKRVAATITAAQLVPKHDAYPTDLEVLVGLVDYDHADLYGDAGSIDMPLPSLTLSVKDTY